MNSGQVGLIFCTREHNFFDLRMTISGSMSGRHRDSHTKGLCSISPKKLKLAETDGYFQEDTGLNNAFPANLMDLVARSVIDMFRSRVNWEVEHMPKAKIEKEGFEFLKIAIGRNDDSGISILDMIRSDSTVETDEQWNKSGTVIEI